MVCETPRVAHEVGERALTYPGLAIATTAAERFLRG